VLRGERSLYDREFFWRTQTREAARSGRWKYVRDANEDHLYDLSVDLGEKTDLKARQPGVFTDLKNRHGAWAAQMLPRPRRT
jgi:arylsulfatase A-like enzyme